MKLWVDCEKEFYNMHLGLHELIPLKTNKNSAPSKNGIGRSQILREHTSIFFRLTCRRL